MIMNSDFDGRKSRSEKISKLVHGALAKIRTMLTNSCSEYIIRIRALKCIFQLRFQAKFYIKYRSTSQQI
jgi:hypothetical protein